MKIDKSEQACYSKGRQGQHYYQDSYLKSVETLLKDSSKFTNIPITPNKDLNYIINSEKIVTDLLKNLKIKT